MRYDERLTKIAEDVGYIRGALPHLATKEYIQTTIAKHQQSCPHASSGRTIAKMAGVIVPLAVALSALVNSLIITFLQ